MWPHPFVMYITTTKAYLNSINFIVNYGSNRLDRVSHMYVFFCNSFLYEVMLFVSHNWHVIFTVFINGIYYRSTFFFFLYLFPTWINSLFSHCCINLLIKIFWVLSLVFLSLGATSIFNKFPHFEYSISLYFY